MKIYVDLDHVDITEYTQVESGEYNTNKINFIFTPEYKDLVKVAIFGCKLDTDEPKFYKIYLSDDSCYLPSEVTSASDVISIGVYAFNVDNGELKLRYSPTPVKTIVYEGSFREEAENSSSPTPTEIEQIMSRIISLEEITSDLNTRVETLENKACDLDSIKEKVTNLEFDVNTINNEIDIIESDIDDLEGDIANTYSKTEVDTLLGSKVDTSTYTSGQAAQDEKIAKAELILSQLPKVTGEGTNFSLSPTIEYDLEVGYKGDTEQDTLTGKNLCPTDVSAYELGQYNTSGDKQNSNARVRTKNLIPVPSDTTLYVTTFNSTYAFILRGYLSDETFSTSYGIITNESTLNIDATIKYISVTIYNVNDSSGSAGQAILDKIQSGDIKPFICLNSVSDKSFEKYCGGIPSPNPNYPQDILAVTGTQEIEVVGKNLFNKTNITSGYRITNQGELVQQTGYYSSDFIKIIPSTKYTKNSPTADGYHKFAFYSTNQESSFISYSTSNTSTTPENCYYIRFCGLSTELDTTQLELGATATTYSPYTSQTYTLHLGDEELAKIPNTNYVDVFKFTNNKWYKAKKVEKIASYNGETITTDYISTTGQLTTGAKVYYGIQEQDIEITNTTLLQDLNYIKEHISSFPDTTNITTSGNLPIIITASALKQLS